MSINKKLFNDNNNLLGTVESKNLEINELRYRLENCMAEISKLQEDKHNLERNVQNLNEVKSSQKIEITKLIEDNQKLSKICQEQDKTLKANELERSKLLTKNDELAFELKNMQGKLRSREENLGYATKQLDDAKSQIGKLNMELREREKQIELQRSDIASLNNVNSLEREAKLEAEKANDELTGLLHDRDREISRLLKDVDNHKSNGQRLNDDKLYLVSENEKLKNHIMILTEQNQKVGI
jgi:chromosome segregation ATPase